MDNNEINKFLHDAIGKCWHKFEIPVPVFSAPTCRHCGATTSRTVANTFANPDYSNDLNAVAVVEKFVIEKVGLREYVFSLRRFVTDTAFALTYDLVVIATARLRAQACYSVLKKEKTK